MRSRPLFSLIALAGLLVVAPHADAGPLISATWSTSFPGRGLTITNSGAMCPDTDPATTGDMVSGCVAGLFPSGSASSTAYTVSLTVPPFSYSQFTTTGVIPFHTQASLSGAQLITGNESSAMGIPGVAGYLTVKTAQHTKESGLAPGMSTLVKVPLSVGRKGQFTNYFVVIGVLHYMTVDFYAWTPHTLTFTGLTNKGTPLPDVVAMGSHNLGSYRPPSKVPMSQIISGTDGGGVVTLVSPSKVTITGSSFNARKTVSFTTLKLTYFGEHYIVHGTPEPASVLLLGAGVAVVVLVRTRKRG